MKKRGKKPAINIKINFTNRWLYTLILFGIIIGISVGVYAYGGRVAPSIVGHTINETAPPSPCAANQYLQWTGSAWICAAPAGLPTCAANQILYYTGSAWACHTAPLYNYSETDPIYAAGPAWAKTDSPTIPGVITASSNINVAGTVNMGYFYSSGFCSSCTSLPIGCGGTGTPLRIIGGGCSSSPLGILVKSFPNSPTSWQCDYTSATRITTYVICARMG